MIKDILTANEEATPNGREIALLKEHFPACFRPDGSFDLGRFKEYLNDQVSVVNEGYELRFLGKNYARLLASTDTATVILPDEAHNAKPENANSRNIYISGDNLDGLKHLLRSYARKVKCIYIDPPYNTGSDGFVYHDSFRFTPKELSDKLSISQEQAQRILDLAGRGSASHSAWLMFLYPRLLLARDLLTDDGVIFISIDDNEQANLKLLCDDVFGEENYINSIAVKAKNSSGASGGGEDKRLKKNVESVLWYARNREAFVFRAPVRETTLSEYIEEHKQEGVGFYYTRVMVSEGTKQEVARLNEGTDDEIRVYEHTGFELQSVNALATQQNRTPEEVYLDYFDRIFMVTNAQTSLLTKVNEAVKEKQKLLSYAYVPKTGKRKGQQETKYVWNKTLVVWLRDSAYIKGTEVIKTEQIGTMWDDISWGRLDVEGDMPYKNGKKPTALIRRLINMVADDEDLVLDFFSGSASTAHACMLENADGKRLQCISIQLPENMDEAFAAASTEKKKDLQKLFDILDGAHRPHFLDEVGQERILRAAQKIRQDAPDTTADLGFRHYTLAEPSDETLDKLERFDPEDTGLLADQTILDAFGLPAVLATWLVRDGYGFTAPVQQVDFGGYTAYAMDKHLYLISPELSEAAIAAILARFETEGSFHPENIVLFGYSFTWTELEALKVNLARLSKAIHFDIRY